MILKTFPRWGLLLIAILIPIGAILVLVQTDSTTARFIRLLVRQDQTWQAIQERGTWRVGMDPSFPPFESLNEQGVPVGYDVDLAHAIAARWGVEVEIIAIGFDSLVDALRAGKIDSVISALPYDPRATQDVIYSPPYFDAGIRLAVPTDSDIQDSEDLAGKTVAVEWGSMSDMVGRRLQREEIELTLFPYETPEEAVAALLEKNEIDALLIDNVSLQIFLGRYTGLHAVGPALESNPYVIASPLRSDRLAEHIATTLDELRTTGELDAIGDKWFGAPE